MTTRELADAATDDDLSDLADLIEGALERAGLRGMFALNPRMKLFKDISAWEVAHQQNLREVIAAAEEYLNNCGWAIYDVQRVFRPHGAKKDEPLTKSKAKALGVPYKPGMVTKHPGDTGRKGQAWRRTVQARSGTRQQMTSLLGSARDGRYEPGRTPRLWLVEKQNTYPARERLLVAAPAGVLDKEEDGFAALWAETTALQGHAGQLTERPVAPLNRRD